jgi:glycosyltransferase involved in cell wall biosynthesis
MRVLHLLDHSAPRRSDYSRRTLALLEGLRTQGVQTVHLTGPRHGAQAAAHSGTDHWHFYRTSTPACLERLGPGLGAAARTAALALRLRQVARLTRPDLIHVHLPTSNGLAALPVAHLARVPLVVEAERRGGLPPAPGPGPQSSLQSSLQSWLERRVLGAAEAIATSTAQVRAQLRTELRTHARAGGVAGRHIAVVPPAPDLQACRLPAALRPGLSPPGLEGAPLLAYAGGLEPEDGIGLLLAALGVLRRRQPALRLLVAGGGEREDALADRLGVRPLRGHVVFTGSLSYRRAADLLPRADIVVFPAMAAARTLAPSRHLLNAMAQGCAIVASDIDCHRELLVHGHSAILFQSGSRAALVEAIAGLLDEPRRLALLGAEAASYVDSRRSWNATATRYRQLYERVLADSGRGRR